MPPEPESIQAEIINILKGMTEEWDLDIDDFTSETRLSADLGLSSIDALHLVASIDMKFGRRLPYEQLILKDGKYVDELNIGQLSAFVLEFWNVDASGPKAL